MGYRLGRRKAALACAVTAATLAGVLPGHPAEQVGAVDIDDVHTFFDYSMPSRYVADGDGDLPNAVPRVQCSDAADASSCVTIEPTIDVEPSDGWRVDLHTCESTPGPDEITYEWRMPETLGGTVEVQHDPGDPACEFFAVFPEEGTFEIDLVLIGPGFSVGYSRLVIVQDFLIVALGDSAGAGEGAPDDAGTDSEEPVWVDRRCHRSAFNGTARAALLLEELDPHTSVTYVNLACSGAKIMEGLLEPYAGVDRLSLDKYPEVELARAGEIDMLPPQVQAAAELVGDREIDALDISIGVNDAHFAEIVQSCALAEPCETATPADTALVVATLVCFVLSGVPIVGALCGTIALLIVGALEAALGEGWPVMTAREVVDEGIDGDGSSPATCVTCGLEEGYSQLAGALLREPTTQAGAGRASVGLGLPAVDSERVYISEYMDPTTKPLFDGNDPSSDLCGGIEDTFTMFPGVSRTETSWMRSYVLPHLNGGVSDGAAEHGWEFVDDISSAFYEHGYCAEENWIVTLADTFRDQHDMQGVIHPNRAGYRVFRNRILNDWLPDLYPDDDGFGPGITGLTSTADVERLAADHLEFHPDARRPAIPFVTAGTAYTVREGDVRQVAGSATDISDSDLDLVWSIADSAPPGAASLLSTGGLTALLRGNDDGSGHVALTATNDAGRSSSALAFFLVENVPPSVDAGSNGTVAEGSLFSRAITLTDPGPGDSHSGFVTWGDGTSDAFSSLAPPSFDISHVYADNGAYPVTVCAEDDDLGSDCSSFTLTVTNAAPVVAVGSATAAEGAVATLPATTINDPGAADTHLATVNWGDGTASQPAVVTEAPFGPPGSTSGLTSTVTAGGHVYADNGQYTVTVCATDDDTTSPSCGTGALTVTNVAPTAAVTTFGEGPGFFLPLVSIPLSGTFHDAGTLDTHTAAVAWGDGTTSHAIALTETPSGPPGSSTGLDGSVNAAHLYNSAGNFTLTLTVTDDDTAPGSASRPVEVLSPADAVERTEASLRTLAADASVRAAARSALQKAITDLNGSGDGPGNNGADDKLRDGDRVSAIVKLQSAIANLEAAIKADANITTAARLAELVIAQIAESVATSALALATAAVSPTSTSGQAKLAKLRALLDEGRALRAVGNYVGATARDKDVTQGSLALVP